MNFWMTKFPANARLVGEDKVQILIFSAKMINHIIQRWLFRQWPAGQTEIIIEIQQERKERKTESKQTTSKTKCQNPKEEFDLR